MNLQEAENYVDNQHGWTYPYKDSVGRHKRPLDNLAYSVAKALDLKPGQTTQCNSIYKEDGNSSSYKAMKKNLLITINLINVGLYKILKIHEQIMDLKYSKSENYTLTNH